MKENKAQRKQSKHKRVFFRFGDDLAVGDKPYGASVVRRKSASQTPIESPRKEIANGFVDYARTYPSGRISGGIGQTASRDANPNVVRFTTIFIHKKVRNGSAAAADGNGGGVGVVVGKRRPRAPNSRRSGSHRLNVVGVRTRK